MDHRAAGRRAAQGPPGRARLRGGPRTVWAVLRPAGVGAAVAAVGHTGRGEGRGCGRAGAEFPEEPSGAASRAGRIAVVGWARPGPIPSCPAGALICVNVFNPTEKS